MTYHPLLSDNEHATLIAGLNLLARHVGAQVAEQGISAAESGAGKLSALRDLTEKLNGSKVETAQIVDDEAEKA